MEESAAAGRTHAHPMVTSTAIGACIGLLIAAAFGVRYLSETQAAAAFRPLVETQTVTPGPIRAQLVYSGLVQPTQQVAMTAPAAGTIASVDVAVGATVRAGDRLVTLASESLPAQIQQGRAEIQAAEARRAQLLVGPRSTEIASARAVLAAAESRLAQLTMPSSADIAGARAAAAIAQSNVSSAEAATESTRAILLGAIAGVCATPYSFGLPCAATEVPLSPQAVESAQSFLQTRVGDARSDIGQRAVAVLTANAAYRTALSNLAAGADAVASARARLDALWNPTAAELSAQRAQVAIARDTIEAKLTPPNDADLQAVTAAIARAQAQLAITEASLARLTIVAPFDGVVTQRFAEQGMSVTPQTQVVALAAKGAEVHLAMRDADSVQIAIGLAAEITLAGDPRPLAGRIRSIAPTGDLRTHTVDVNVVADGAAAERLRPGALAEVRLLTAQKTTALTVPSSAVITDGPTVRVFVVVDEKVRVREVTTGLTDHANTELTNGITAGDLVVVRGQNALRDGQSVRISK